VSNQPEEFPIITEPPDPPIVDIPTTDVAEASQIPLSKRLRNLQRQLRQQGLLITLIEAYDQTFRMITGVPTVRYSQVTPDIFLGGQHIKRGMPRLWARGITGIVSLRREFDDRDKHIDTAHYLYLPTLDNTPPTLENLQRGAEFIAGEIARGGKVYIHCWEGVGRAPTMTAAYLVSTGLTPDEAWARIRAARPFIRPTPFQMAQVEQFAKRFAETTASPTNPHAGSGPTPIP
jgi:protein-tyrosine phosphatase